MNAKEWFTFLVDDVAPVFHPAMCTIPDTISYAAVANYNKGDMRGFLRRRGLYPRDVLESLEGMKGAYAQFVRGDKLRITQTFSLMNDCYRQARVGDIRAMDYAALRPRSSNGIRRLFSWGVLQHDYPAQIFEQYRNV